MAITDPKKFEKCYFCGKELRLALFKSVKGPTGTEWHQACVQCYWQEGE